MDLHHQGLLVVVSGPSAVGKGTICRKLLTDMPELVLSISCTTRKARANENEGDHYFFMQEDAFARMIQDHAFIEYAQVYGHYYGTPLKYVQQNLDQGRDVLLEIDTQGAMQVMERMPHSIFIFILPPSLAALRERIEKRGTESPESIKRRLSAAKDEINSVQRYQYCVVNHQVHQAAQQIQAIITAEKCSVKNNTPIIKKLFELQED